MKKTIFLLLCTIFSLQFFAQTSVKLSGTTVSSNNNNDGYNYNNSTDHNGNKAANCFDGDLTTYFASSIDESNANGGTKGSRGSKGGWVGLDLGSKHVITSVKYAPRPAEPGRVECGVIQGANSPDFMDAVAIGIIPSSAPANQLSTLTINSTRGFRYVRYYGSLQFRCNIAELEFWGYAGNGNDTYIGQLTNLPTVNIHTTNEARVVDKINYVTGTISVVDGNTIVSDGLEIRGRGNASWNFKKRPYRIKLTNSTNLLGSPAKARNWTLISNEGDKTLMRNLIAFDISKRLDMPYTPAGKLVDVVINGDYKGCYQLCDHIDVRKGRVDINEMTPADVNAVAITGGYMMEINANLKEESNWRNLGFETDRGMPVEIKSPDYEDGRTQAQTDYIRNHIKTWESAVMNNNNYQQYTDIESFCKFFLVGEFSGNTDTFWQTKIYKKRSDDKIYFGPVWDFDLAFENDQRTYQIMQKTKYERNNQWLFLWEWRNNSGSSTADGMRPFVNRLISYNDVYQELRDIWAYSRDHHKITEEKLMQTIDNYVVEINTSQDLNFKRWDNLFSYEHMIWERGDYANNIKILKDYVKERLDWLDYKLAYVPNPVDPKTVISPKFENVQIFSRNNELTISNLSELTKISCYNTLGKIIFEDFAQNDFSKTLPQGIYLLKLSKQNGVSETYKCIVK